MPWLTDMPAILKTDFDGFPAAAVRFYEQLARNNNKTWFAEHKADFETHVMQPARDFVFEMGKKLSHLAPGIVADPRMDKSIFRPYRDTRFSKDKAPYKTHLGIFFWEGVRPKMECSGFYFHLEPPTLFLGTGIHCFSKPLLEEFRNSVVHPKHGRAFAKAVQAVLKKGVYGIGGKHYKKTPRGFDPQHSNAEFLLFDGLYAMFEEKIPEALHSKEILDYCLERFEHMAPVHRWLVELTGRLG
jgi:uncharacterized protein (TIGR02453 family)